MKVKIALVYNYVCKFFKQYCTRIGNTKNSRSQTFFDSENVIFISFFLRDIYSPIDDCKVIINLEFYKPSRPLKTSDDIVISFPWKEKIDFEKIKERVFKALLTYIQGDTFTKWF